MNNFSSMSRRLQSSYTKAQLKSYCDLLGVPVKASEAKIKQAFYKKSLIHHPDRNPGSERSAKLFAEINEAYQALIFDRRAGQSEGAQDFSNRWKYKSSTEFRQFHQSRPETQRASSTTWQGVYSEENEEARRRFSESGDMKGGGWYGRFYTDIVKEDFAKSRAKRRQVLKPNEDSSCRIM